MIATIRKYANCEPTIENGYDDGFMDWHFRQNNHEAIYNKMMSLTDGDHEISSDAASWCELACEGDCYDFREGEIEIEDI